MAQARSHLSTYGRSASSRDGSVLEALDRAGRDRGSRGDARIRVVVHRAARGRIRAGVRGLRGCAPCPRCQFVHRGAAPVADRHGNRPWRRSHHDAVDVLCNRERRHPCRGDAGLRRHRSRFAQPRSGRRQRSDHAAHARADAGALRRLPRGHAGVSAHRGAAWPADRRGRRALRRRDLGRPQGWSDRRLHLFQFLRDEEPDHRRRWDGDDQRRRSDRADARRLAARHEPRRVDDATRRTATRTTTSSCPASNTT